MMSDLAVLAIDSPRAVLTINRPDSRNALSIDLLEALHARVDELARHAEQTPPEKRVRVVTITGSGKAFCAGMDLKQVIGDPTGAAPRRLLGTLAELCIKVRALPMVTIAAVNGAAIGGGCGLTTVCDFAITHADSKMGFPEVDLGVCPAVVAPWLVRKIGAGRARSVLLRGGLMSGREACELGLVSECVETREELMTAAEKLAERLAAGGAAALVATKGLLNELDGSLDRELAAKAAELSASVLMTPEAQAMLKAKFN